MYCCSACIGFISSLAEVSNALLASSSSNVDNGNVVSLDPRLLSRMTYKLLHEPCSDVEAAGCNSGFNIHCGTVVKRLFGRHKQLEHVLVGQHLFLVALLINADRHVCSAVFRCAAGGQLEGY